MASVVQLYRTTFSYRERSLHVFVCMSLLWGQSPECKGVWHFLTETYFRPDAVSAGALSM